MTYKYIAIIFLFVTKTAVIHSQYIEDQSSSDFVNITAEDGLSQNTVNTILKDKTGYVWFGTDDGLNRYNSFDITIIDIHKDASKILTGKKVFDLFEDLDGIIWIGTDDGLKIYNPITEKVHSCDLFQNFHTSIQIHSIIPENNTQLWLGTSQGLILYDSKDGVIEHYRHDSQRTNSLSDSQVFSLAMDIDDLWIGTNNGLNRFHKKTKKFQNYFYDKSTSNTIGGNSIKSLTIGTNGDLYIGTLQGGVSILQKKTEQFYTYTTANSLLPHNEIFDLFLTKENDLWVATNGGGVAKIHKDKTSFTVYKHEANHPKSLVTNSIYSVYEDRDGILWVGTYAAGVCYNSSKNSVFKLIRHQVHDPNSIVESRIRSLFLDSKENLWFGTWGGVSVYNPETKKYRSFVHESENPNSLSFNTVTSIMEDTTGNMWFGTYSGGLNLLKPNTQNFIHYNHQFNDENSISDDKIYSIAQDALQNLWVGTQNGLNRYNSATNDFERFSNFDIRDIKFTKAHNLALATLGGILIFNPKTKEFKEYYADELKSFPISQLYLETDNNLIWFCSQGGGMGYLDLNNSKYTFFTEKNGLPSNFVSSLVPTDNNGFWISTFKGLAHFDKSNHLFENFGDAYKLPSKQFQPKASIVLPDESVGFGGAEGVVIFSPENISKRKKNSTIVLSSLKIDNKKAIVNSKNSPLHKSISKTDELHFKSNQNDFSVDFTALDFSNQAGNKYSYILENYMNEWVDIGSKNAVGFTNLNHGAYVLKIRVNNGSTKESEKSLNITIEPPFYATWWFKLLIFILLILILYYYKKYTIISIEQKNENKLQRLKLKNEEDFNQMRFRFFTYISHELRTPLTLIADPIAQLINNQKDSNKKDLHLMQLINKNVFRLLRLVDQILDISKLEGDTLSLQVSKQNIIKCIEDTASAFHEFAIQNDITFKFETKDKELFGWVDEDKIEKILYNLLSNAFKFTVKNGTIQIILDYADESKKQISIRIKDNGIGIAEDKLNKIFEGFYQVKSAKSLNPNGAGIGLDYVNRLIKLHKGTIHVASELHVGSTFTVTIPIKKEFYDSKNIRNYVPERVPLKPIKILKQDEDAEIVTKSHNRNTAKILVVEDDYDIRAYIVEALSEKFRIIEAPNGEEALVKALKHIPDLILSDTLMPIMDGIEFCKRIKENEKTNHIPFLFLSAWTSDEFKIKGLSIGAIDYIQKPFSIKILESRISNIVETSKKISEKSKTKVDFIPENKSVDSTDDVFVRKAYDVLDKNFANSDFNAHEFKIAMHMSHSGLYRKLKQLTGKSSNEFIRDYRLKRATQIIKQDSGLLIAEVCTMTGFNDPKYFSKCFKQVYDMTPSEFTKKYADSVSKGE